MMMMMMMREKMKTLTDARLFVPLVGWEDESTNCTTLSNDCLNHTCLNGASCVDGVRSYTCLCPPGYTGNLAVIAIAVIVVVVVVVTIRRCFWSLSPRTIVDAVYNYAYCAH